VSAIGKEAHQMRRAVGHGLRARHADCIEAEAARGIN
jgi:hypothetical protein